MSKRFLPIIAGLVLALAVAGYWYMNYSNNNASLATGQKIQFVVKPGMTTADIANMLHKLKLINTPESFRMGMPTEKKVAKGDFITFDFGATYKGYRSDITRTLVMGEAAAWQREVYDIVLQANLLGENSVKAGITGFEVDAKARKFIADNGYGAYFGHGLGHGVGMDIHEQPVLSRRDTKTILPVNAVVTIEPGIYIPGKGGVRIEDTVVVTQDGCHILTATPKQLLEIS
jgi:Xaa-Pro aminopeptidase